ncbi:hypothetical protein CWE14_13395 [Aliidiomarina soli]|uniref:Uncharacterized protein n=1 Tax=Aliidiomarina soli TaxID=1928574 RepID=A0A432WD88_9GAMM|nr:hypothetical protein CWE14_13395 [Aliidiomarina soli]
MVHHSLPHLPQNPHLPQGHQLQHPPSHLHLARTLLQLHHHQPQPIQPQTQPQPKRQPPPKAQPPPPQPNALTPLQPEPHHFRQQTSNTPTLARNKGQNAML